MTYQLLKQYLELGRLSMHKKWIYTKKNGGVFEKTMKTYFNVIVLSL